MERRDFVGSAALAALAGMAGTASAGRQDPTPARVLLEWREFSTLSSGAAGALSGQLETALVPALNRLGLEPVGVFRPVYGSASATVHVLIPHPSLESVLTLHAKLLDDQEFVKSAGPLLQGSPEEAAYVRIKSSLMQAFEDMPRIEVPPQTPRIFELRRYESHNIRAGKLKVEMFNEGEIDIFRKTGLTPVFFGETLVGDLMPNLVYMLAFDDMAARDAAWDRFRVHPDWKRMSGMERYQGTVSNISDTILRPESYSQV